jgi:hypothetical protein
MLATMDSSCYGYLEHTWRVKQKAMIGSEKKSKCDPLAHKSSLFCDEAAVYHPTRSNTRSHQHDHPGYKELGIGYVGENPANL